VLTRFPDAILVGDVSDYHLAFPQHEHRMRMMQENDEIDLGGRSFRAVEPVVRDMRTTGGALRRASACCFPATASPTATITRITTAARRRGGYSLDLQDTTAVFADLALWWTKWADMRNYCARLDLLMDKLASKRCARRTAWSSPTSPRPCQR